MNRDKNSIVIFSGTSEGRELSEKLDAAGVDHLVCVASEFGEVMQPAGEHIQIRRGRMDAVKMREFLIDRGGIVIDATHPYAEDVSKNIQMAITGCDIEYLRITRDMEHEDYGEYYDDATSCANALSDAEGNILFTTGSRNLAVLCENIRNKDRLYARVLPVAESIENCKQCGIRDDHIIAMTGPFSEAMNIALIYEYHIACMVTKDGGRAGGFKEKISAARKLGIRFLCIRRPSAEIGYDVESAYRYIVSDISAVGRTDGYKGTRMPKRVQTIEDAHIAISVIGTGMGNIDGFTIEAQSCIENADIIFGSKRVVEPFREREVYPYFWAADIAAKLSEEIYSGHRSLNVAVLFSGDVSFYSGASNFTSEISAWARREKVEIGISWIPGISSVSALAAKLKVPYQDAGVYSLHGRDSKDSVTETALKIRRNRLAFVLLSGAEDAALLSDELAKLSVDGYITVASRLSYPDERIVRFNIGEYKETDMKSPVVAFIRNDSYVNAEEPIIPYREDDEFERNETPMTKSVIRHECIRLLKLSKRDVLYDIGSGTGSVSIEAAGLSDNIMVYSFEMKKPAAAIERKNIEKFGLSNVTLIEGRFPGSSETTPTPDAVFIGGSGGEFGAIINRLKQYNRSIRVVATAVSIETRNAIYGLYDDKDVTNLSIREIAVSTADKVGGYHMMRAENPVMIAAFDLEGEGED